MITPDCQAAESLLAAVGPQDPDLALIRAGRGKPEEDARVAGRSVAAIAADTAPQRGFAGQLDAGAERIPGAAAAEQAQAQPAVAVTDPVFQHPRRTGIIGNDHIGIAVVVEVAEGGAAADPCGT